MLQLQVTFLPFTWIQNERNQIKETFMFLITTVISYGSFIPRNNNTVRNWIRFGAETWKVLCCASLDLIMVSVLQPSATGSAVPTAVMISQ